MLMDRFGWDLLAGRSTHVLLTPQLAFGAEPLIQLLSCAQLQSLGCWA